MPPLNTIFLDVGWTLVYPKESLWTTLADVTSQAGKPSTADEVERIVFHLMMAHREQALVDFEVGSVNYTDSDEKFQAIFRHLGRIVFQILGVGSNHEDLIESAIKRFGLVENWAIFPDVIPAMTKLRARGVSIFALSNAASGLVDFLDNIGLASHMDGMIVSAIEGVRKPDPRIFQKALDLAGASPADAVHVGDMVLEDVMGARNAGILPFLMDRGPRGMFPHHQESMDVKAEQGVDVVTSLDEVLKKIGDSH